MFYCIYEKENAVTSSATSNILSYIFHHCKHFLKKNELFPALAQVKCKGKKKPGKRKFLHLPGHL
jgi:hypothetical protein